MAARPPPGATLHLPTSPGPAQRAALLRAAAVLLDDHEGPLRCVVSALDADTRGIDAVARLALLARRRGTSIELVGASPALFELLELAGLASALGARTPDAAAARTTGKAARSKGRT